MGRSGAQLIESRALAVANAVGSLGPNKVLAALADRPNNLMLPLTVAAEWGVSRTTVTAAYGQLIVEATWTRGKGLLHG